MASEVVGRTIIKWWLFMNFSTSSPLLLFMKMTFSLKNLRALKNNLESFSRWSKTHSLPFCPGVLAFFKEVRLLIAPRGQSTKVMWSFASHSAPVPVSYLLKGYAVPRCPHVARISTHSTAKANHTVLYDWYVYHWHIIVRNVFNLNGS